ncbi:MAG: NUDIX domain-containing protein [Bacilli bacterium]|nr:NUDIX domain-containing protein [Bacilli bacterium]
MKYEKSCGAIVYREIDHQLSYLLVQMNLGHFSFPKGHMESGETEVLTALREIKEETNVDCLIIDGFREQIQYSPYPGVLKDVIYFVGKAMTLDIIRQVEEIKDIMWCTYDEALQLITYSNEQVLLKRANLFLLSKGKDNEK